MIRVFFLLLIFATNAFAVDVTMEWDASFGASFYKIRISTDGGKRWGAERRTVGTETILTWVMAPEDKLILFKVAACADKQSVFNNYAGCWYDHRLRTTETDFPIIWADTDCKIGWDSIPTATGYELFFSVDRGNTWPVDISLGDVTGYTWEEAPNNAIILIKGCSDLGCRPWAGAWYDGRFQHDAGGHLYWQYPSKTIYLKGF